MKLLIEIEYEIDGELNEKEARGIIHDKAIDALPYVITSEDIDGAHDWAIVVDSITADI